MNLLKWDKMADHKMTLEQFKGQECWLGVDLASKNDLAALAIMFKKEIERRMHYYLFVKHYLPGDAVKASENAAHYDGWVRRGLITVTPGAMLDVDRIEADTDLLGQMFNVIDLAFDPGHNSTQYGVHMLDKGFNVIEVRPTVMNFSDPMKWMQVMVADGIFHHVGCPVLTWEVSNTVCKLDAKDNVYPRKEFAERKIDGVVAALMALNRAKADENSTFDQELLVV